MPYSTYLATAQLNWLAGSTFPTAPANLYVTIHSATPGDTGSAANITNTITGSANRILLAQSNLAAVAAASGGGYERITAAVLTITAASVNGSATTATHFAVWDAITGGNLLLHDALTASVIIDTGAEVKFPIGDLKLRCI
jgi:hypothetical protein